MSQRFHMRDHGSEQGEPLYPCWGFTAATQAGVVVDWWYLWGYYYRRIPEVIGSTFSI